MVHAEMGNHALVAEYRKALSFVTRRDDHDDAYFYREQRNAWNHAVSEE